MAPIVSMPRRTGGHPSGRRTGGHGGGRYTTDGHTCLRYGGREDTEGAPTWRQGKVYQQLMVFLYYTKACLSLKFSTDISSRLSRWALGRAWI